MPITVEVGDGDIVRIGQACRTGYRGRECSVSSIEKNTESPKTVVRGHGVKGPVAVQVRRRETLRGLLSPLKSPGEGVVLYPAKWSSDCRKEVPPPSLNRMPSDWV